MSGGTALISDSAVRSILNPVVLTGDVTFGTFNGANSSAVAANGVTLNGTFSLGAATRSINVNSVLNTSTMVASSATPRRVSASSRPAMAPWPCSAQTPLTVA